MKYWNFNSYTKHVIIFSVSISQPTRIIGLFLAGFLSEKIGRKKSLIVASILQIVVACSVYFCSCFESLVVVVALSNLFSCMVQVPSYALLSEICLIRHRAHLATLNTFNSNCGWLIGLSLGLVIPIQFYYVALCFPSVIFLLLCWKLPESPVWLLRTGQEKEARRTLAWLRGEEYDIEPEMDELRSVTKETVSEDVKGSDTSANNYTLKRSILTPLCLTCTMFIFQALCGESLISYYNGIIFKHSGVRPEHVAILYQVRD